MVYKESINRMGISTKKEEKKNKGKKRAVIVDKL
jgi:hypothetical protein